VTYLGVTPTAVLKDLEDRALVQHNLTADVSTVDGNSVNTLGDISQSTRCVEGSSEHPESVVSKVDCNIALAMSGAVAPPWEPRNAQNPTVERNTHWSSSEEFAVEGNTLIVKRPCGHRESTAHNVPSSFNENSANSSSNIHPTVNRTISARPTSVVRPGPQHRISFVQNPMEASVGAMPLASSGPKRQNVPGNGRTEASCAQPDRRQCEVILVDGAMGTTVVRPTSLPVDVDARVGELADSSRISHIDLNSLVDGNIHAPETGRSNLHGEAAEAGLLREGNRSHTSVELMRKTSGEREAELPTVHSQSTTVDAMHQQFNDNLAFESSTSPRFDAPVAIRRVW